MQEKLDLAVIKVVSWDVDGTLYSLREMRWNVLRLALRQAASKKVLTAGQELIALWRHGAIINAVRKSGGALDRARHRTQRAELLAVEERWYGPAIRRAGPRPGAVGVLDFFSAVGKRQVVLSDYEAEYKLRLLDLEHYFFSRYAGECLGFVKPNPGGFLTIAADLGISPSNILHIGDRADRDGQAARAAGCQCLILGRDFRDFHVLLEKLRDMSST